MITIHKFNIPGHCEGPIKQILNVKMQYGKPVVWVMLDDSITEKRALDFYTIGTGWELVDDDEKVIKQSVYIGTVKDEEGYIWHCFAVAVEPEEKEDTNKNNEEKDAVSANASVESSIDDAENLAQPQG